LSCCITCGGTAHFFLWKVLFFKGQSTSMFTFANTIFQTFQYNLSLCVYVDTCIGDCLSLPTGYARNILYIILYIHYFSEQVKLPPACAKTVHLWPSAEYQVIASDKNLEKTNKTHKTADPMRHLLKAFRHGSAVFLFSQGFGNLCPTLSKTSRKQKKHNFRKELRKGIK
jgi:hypothetical protein